MKIIRFGCKLRREIKIINSYEEIKISLDFKYYNTESSIFNEFIGDNYNKISKMAKENIAKKIEGSILKANAKNRLVSELSKIFFN